jgi:hypothetical protein
MLQSAGRQTELGARNKILKLRGFLHKDSVPVGIIDGGTQSR